MLGFKFARIARSRPESKLPWKSLGLFRKPSSLLGGKTIERGDLVLVDHPEAGRVVRKVYAVSRTNQYHLEGANGRMPGEQRLNSVSGANIKGVLLAKLF